MPAKTPIGKPAPRPASTSRTLPKPGPTPVQQEEDEQQETGEVQSKEDAFDNAEPEVGFGIPNGGYRAHLVKCVVDRQAMPKESVMFGYEIAEGDFEGKQINSWYNLFDKEGKAMKGIGYFKRDCEVLGQPSFKLAEIDEAMQNLEQERLLCNINVKQNGQWTNVFLQGLAEG
jgi:hypothetical protein